ncbi:hypothetical protein ACIQU6_10540 [Streptomyces sp. NPDC090442]|uniref:hypothetical protein n=1 Tax=Streptomyces sp. NPDC090442 TaxID=3365962 RepID=UPI00380E25C7
MVVLDVDGPACGVAGETGGDDQLGAEWRELVWAATAPGAGSGGGAAGRLSGVLLGVPDATPYLGVLRLLADRITERSTAAGGFAATGLAAFGPVFWRCLALAAGDRMALLRRLLPADGPRAARSAGASRSFARPPRVRVHAADAGAVDEWVDVREWPLGPGGASCPAGAEAFRPGGPELPPARFLDLAAELLKADPERIQPLLCGWFDDIRPLRAAPGAPRVITVADAAQALLHTHRTRALDALVETLAGTAHPRAAELLDALAEDEPAAVRRVEARRGGGPSWWGRPPLPEPVGSAARGGGGPDRAAGWPMQQRPGHPSREAARTAWQS